MNPPVPARRVAVTGAGGFIGRRLADMLEQSGAEVRRLTRRTTPLDDASRLAGALSGCTAVVHCAYDAYDEAANLRMAETLGHVCATSGTRLVHLSTAAVYEPLPDGVLTEAAPTNAPGTAYKAAKLAIERCLLDLVRTRRLDLVVLQPTIVYGPAGGAWTDSPVRELLTGEVWLPDAGRGLCNAVHVDDVCRAAMAACTAGLASGERLLISGPAPVTWAAFLGAYQTMLGTDSLRFEPPGRGFDPAPAAPPPAASRQRLKQMLLGRLGAAGRSRVNFMMQHLRSRLLGRKALRAEGAKRALYEARCRVSTAKAEGLLGFYPDVGVEAGMAATLGYVIGTYGKEASSPFLKKRTKKLLLSGAAATRGMASDT